MQKALSDYKPELPHPAQSLHHTILASFGPSHPPTIDPKYLFHPLDLEVIAHHAQYLETIAATEPWHRTLLKPNGRRNTPGAYVSSIEKAKDYVRSASASNWHAVGTFAMLPREMGGVVDANLVVYGTTNLRVVDASIMPSIPQCNTQSVVYAVAERAAVLIKGGHRCPREILCGMNNERLSALSATL